MKHVGWGVVTVGVLIIIGFVFAACLGYVPVDAVSTPPRWEGAVLGSILNRSLAHRASELKNPIEMTDANLRLGMDQYEDHCAACHGDGKGTGPLGETRLYPRAPQFGKELPNLSSPSMFVAVKYGIRYSGMPSWNGRIADDDIWRIATLLANLKRLPPSVANKWRGATR